MKPLTDKQARVLRFIVSFRDAHGFVPSSREVREGLGLKSQTSVQHYLGILIREGFLSDPNHKARAYRVLKEI